MVEIKAGPELDKAVSEAISDVGAVHPEGFMSPALTIPFRPSIDLNAAFDAAEAAGLFHVERGSISLSMASSGRNRGLWRVEHRGDGDPWPDVVYESQPTPALAICAAILKLKG